MDIRHAVGVRKGVSAEKLTDILRYREMDMPFWLAAADAESNAQA